MHTEGDVELSHDDLPWSAPMLIYSSPSVPDSLKDNIPKTVISVVGRLKLGSNKILHIVASDKEWNYIGRSLNISINKNIPSQDDFDDQLDDIEEKYAKKKSASNKRIRTNPSVASSSKASKNSKLSNDQFLEAASQINPNVPVSNKNSVLIEQDD